MNDDRQQLLLTFTALAQVWLATHSEPLHHYRLAAERERIWAVCKMIPRIMLDATLIVRGFDRLAWDLLAWCVTEDGKQKPAWVHCEKGALTPMVDIP